MMILLNKPKLSHFSAPLGIHLKLALIRGDALELGAKCLLQVLLCRQCNIPSARDKLNFIPSHTSMLTVSITLYARQGLGRGVGRSRGHEGLMFFSIICSILNSLQLNDLARLERA